MPTLPELAHQRLTANPDLVVFGPIHGYPRTRSAEHRVSFFTAPVERIAPADFPALEHLMDGMARDLAFLLASDTITEAKRTRLKQKRDGSLTLGRLTIKEQLDDLRQVWELPGPKGTFVLDMEAWEKDRSLIIVPGRQRFEKTPKRLTEVCLYGDKEFAWYVAEYNRQYYAGSVDYDPTMQKLRHEAGPNQVRAMQLGNPPLPWLAEKLDRFRP